jgi:molybdate transport system ATP-binding protein
VTLRLEGLRVALAEFDLALDLTLEGPVTAIVGPSGAGKTSLLEAIAGLRAPRQGRIQLDDEVLVDVASGVSLRPRERRLGYLTQDDTLFPHLSVERNLAYGAPPLSRERTEEVTRALQIGSLGHRSPAELSGGERRRVALGRALLASPRLLLLDEPLTGLNAELRAEVTSLFVRLKANGGPPMLYVTHVPDEAKALADETVEIQAGTVTRHVREAAAAVSSAPRG